MMKKQAAIYARVSSKKQNEGETIQSQVASLVEYAQKHAYNIPEGWVFTDDGITGSILSRPALDALRELIRESVVDAVLIHSPDRLSRKYAYQLLLELEFEKMGVELVFLNTPKAKTTEEQLSLHFKGIYAEYERAQIAERCRRGRLYRAKQGSVSVIATAPLGYDYNKKSPSKEACYTINSDAKTVQLIFRLYVSEHYAITQICRKLEGEGIMTPKGYAKWCNTTVADILKNLAYIGVAHYGKTESYDGIPGRIYRTPKGVKCSMPRHARKERPVDLWMPINVPQIISESDFEAAQVKLQQNKHTASRNTQKPSILQGLLTCGHCGSAYYKKARTEKYVYYTCRRSLKDGSCCGMSVKAEELDNMVWRNIISLLEDPQLLENEVIRRAAENGGSDESKAKIKQIDKELHKLSKARDRLLDAYQEGDCITLDALKARMKDIDLKRKSMLSERSFLEKLVEVDKKQNDLKATLEGFQGLLKRADELSIKEKQNVLRLLVEEIVITDNEVEIRHCIPYSEADSEISPLCSHGYISAQGNALGKVNIRRSPERAQQAHCFYPSKFFL